MAKLKACKICKRLHDNEKCPNCESKESTDTPKGKIFVNNPEKSEIAKKLNINEKGDFAIKVK